MWRLRSLKCGKEYVLLCNKEYKIGRSGVNIQIKEDTSVSRHHASISVTHTIDNLKNPTTLPTVTLTDKSKFGTFIICPRTKISTKVEGSRTLNNGDQIVFGAQQSIFKLKYKPLVISASMIGTEQKLKLQDALLQMGGHIVENWHEKITHLVMDQIKLSIKVTRALVSGCYIVTPRYVYTLLEYLTDDEMQEINPETFLPENGEPTLSKQTCSFKVDPNRRNVFSGKVFVFFLDKQLKVFGFSVSHGGGKAISVNDPSFDENVILDQSVVFMHCKDITIQGTDRYRRIERILLNGNKRFIQEHELGLAVLYCNTSVYCNTDFDLNSQNAFNECTENFSASATSSHVYKTRIDSKLYSDDCVIGDAPALTNAPNMRKRDRDCSAEPEIDNNKRPRAEGSSYEKRASEQNWKEDTTKRISDDNSIGDIRSGNEKSPETGLVRPAQEVNNNATEQAIGDDIASLDDDNLWSQNFNSSSYVSKTKEPPRVSKTKETPFVKEYTKTKNIILSPRSIKNEPVTPRNTAFPNKNSNNSPVKQEVSEVFISVDRGSSDAVSGVKKELPVHVAKIVVVSLVVRRPNLSGSQSVPRNDIGIRCQKKFRKVWPTYMSNHGVQTDSESVDPVVPHIIGRNDMYIQGTCASNTQIKQNVITEWLPRNKKTKNIRGSMHLENSNPFSDL